jgi:hypothetical protein
VKCLNFLLITKKLIKRLKYAKEFIFMYIYDVRKLGQ